MYKETECLELFTWIANVERSVEYCMKHVARERIGIKRTCVYADVIYKRLSEKYEDRVMLVD